MAAARAYPLSATGAGFRFLGHAVNFDPFDYREPSYSPNLWAVARTVPADSTSLSSSSAESGVASTR